MLPSAHRLAIAITLTMAIGVWVVDETGVLDPLDGFLFDRVQRLQAFAPQADDVALLVVEPGDDWNEVVRRLDAFQPRCIAVLHPQPLSLPPLTNLRTPLVINSHHDIDAVELSQILETRQVGESPPSVCRIVPNGGVVRWHHASSLVNTERLPSFEAIVASTVSSSWLPDRFRIGFVGGAASLPFANSRQLVSDELTDSLFRDRVVLVGRRSRLPYGITTPFGQLTTLEYHGQVIQSMLNRAFLVDLPAILQLALLVAAWGTVVIAIPKWDSIFTIRAWLLFTCGTLLCSVVASYAGVWLRPGGLLVCQTICLLFFAERQNALVRRTLSGMGLEFSSQVQSRQWPVWFLRDPEPWKRVAEVYNELLAPSRLVLLKSAPDRVHVEPCVFWGCARDSVVERRRDYRREPYFTAAQDNRPLRIDHQRTFLRTVEGEHQYLSPLTCEGELLGFCVVGISQQRSQSEGFLDDLASISREMARALYRRRVLDRKATVIANWSRSLTHSLSQITDATRTAIGKRMRVEDVHDEGSAASLLLDVFGNRVMTNRQFHRLMDCESIDDEEDTPLRSLTELTGESEATIRDTIRACVLSRQGHRDFFVASRSSRTYRIHYQPVKAKLLGNYEEDVYPFQLLGIRIDVLPGDVTDELDWLDARAEDYSLQEQP